MEYLLSNLNRQDIEKLKQSNINWYPDDITDNLQEVTVCFETEEDRNKAIKLLQIKNYTEYLW